MTASTSVKWVVSSMVGAPTLNGTAGSMIAVLDAFLVNGFGTKAVDSVQITNGICRMNITGASAALEHSVIALAGVTGTGALLNGEQRVKVVTASYVEFACDLPDGSLTGIITFKIAPLGWEKVFSKTNVAVYRPVDPASARPFLRVDDTNALYARVQTFENMTDVDTGIGAAPASVAGGYYWSKRQAAAATGVYWALAGDSRLAYVCVAPHASTSAASVAGFGLYCHPVGDINSYRSGDAWCPTICGAPTATFSDVSGCVFSSNVTTGMTMQRLSAGVGGAVQVSRVTAGTVGAVSGNDGAMGPFPSRADNGLRLSAIVLSDGLMATNGPRGELPGAYHCTQSGVLASMGVDVRLTPGQGIFANRQLLSFGVGVLSGSATGCGFIDVTGPWRD